jgi:hypothetical protein
MNGARNGQRWQPPEQDSIIDAAAAFQVGTLPATV